MKTALIIITFLHGLLHLLGFVKGFELKVIKELTLPISKPMGLLWLAVTVLFLIYAILQHVNIKLNSLINVVNEKGKKLDEGALSGTWVKWCGFLH